MDHFITLVKTYPKLSKLFERSVALYRNEQYFLSNHQQRQAGKKVNELYQIFRKVFHQKDNVEQHISQLQKFLSHLDRMIEQHQDLEWWLFLSQHHDDEDLAILKWCDFSTHQDLKTNVEKIIASPKDGRLGQIDQYIKNNITILSHHNLLYPTITSMKTAITLRDAVIKTQISIEQNNIDQIIVKIQQYHVIPYYYQIITELCHHPELRPLLSETHLMSSHQELALPALQSNTQALLRLSRSLIKKLSQKIQYLKHTTPDTHHPLGPDENVVKTKKAKNTAAPKTIYHNTLVALQPNQKRAALVKVTSTEFNSVYHPCVVKQAINIGRQYITTKQISTTTPVTTLQQLINDNSLSIQLNRYVSCSPSEKISRVYLENNQGYVLAITPQNTHLKDIYEIIRKVNTSDFYTLPEQHPMIRKIFHIQPTVPKTTDAPHHRSMAKKVLNMYCQKAKQEGEQILKSAKKKAAKTVYNAEKKARSILDSHHRLMEQEQHPNTESSVTNLTGTTGLKASLDLAQEQAKIIIKVAQRKAKKLMRKIKKPPQDEVIIEQAHIEAQHIINLAREQAHEEYMWIINVAKEEALKIILASLAQESLDQDLYEPEDPSNPVGFISPNDPST